MLVSDQAYRDVVAPGYPGLSADDFRRVRVEVKKFSDDAWLWVPPAGSGPS
ncbi:hypothetical protein AB0L25_38835 [Spirillospora sp. NPDC052242]